MAQTKAAKPAKKAAADLTEKGFQMIQGSDPRNGIVTLKKFGKGFLLTNTRTGLEKNIATFTKATAEYREQINTARK